jgi:hypothetical protein
MVVNKDNVAEQRLVETGDLRGTLRVIEKGLTKDDRVVVNAVQRAQPGRKVQPKEIPIKEESMEEKSIKQKPVSEKGTDKADAKQLDKPEASKKKEPRTDSTQKTR